MSRFLPLLEFSVRAKSILNPHRRLLTRTCNKMKALLWPTLETDQHLIILDTAFINDQQIFKQA